MRILRDLLTGCTNARSKRRSWQKEIVRREVATHGHFGLITGKLSESML